MNTKTKARIMRKLMGKLSEQQQEAISMDLAMDGSGELGGRIYEFHEEIFNHNFNTYLTMLGLTREEYEWYLTEAMAIEGEHTKYTSPLAYYELQQIQF